MSFKYKGMQDSPLNGKRVVWVGDSNTDYNRGPITEAIEALGGTLHSYALAGYAWENTDNNADATDASGVGQVNNAVTDFCGSNSFFPDDCIFIFMLGTNKYGELGSFDDGRVDTVRGATDYCLKKIAYYGRTIPVGVICPWDGHDNEALRERAIYYGFPVIDLETEVRIIPDSTTSTYGNAYLGGGGNHFQANGLKHFLRIIMNWIQFRL